MTDANLTVPCVRVGCPHKMRRTTVRVWTLDNVALDVPGWLCACGVQTVEGKRL